MNVAGCEKSKTLPRLQYPTHPMMYRTILEALVAPGACLHWDLYRHIHAVFWDVAHPVHLATIGKDLQTTMPNLNTLQQACNCTGLSPMSLTLVWALYRMGMRCSMFP